MRFFYSAGGIRSLSVKLYDLFTRNVARIGDFYLYGDILVLFNGTRRYAFDFPAEIRVGKTVSERINDVLIIPCRVVLSPRLVIAVSDVNTLLRNPRNSKVRRRIYPCRRGSDPYRNSRM